MAKDPAFLFYPGDWQGGTATMTRHTKGCYMDLLIAQFNSGPLSLEEIKVVLGNDFAVWGALSKKFKQTEQGLFFNERLDSEKNKRIAYSKSRSDNRSSTYVKSYDDTHEEHMIDHMENENENKDEKENKNKNPKFSFREALIKYGFSADLVNDWMLVRKTKKATNSETAFKNFITEIEKKNCVLDEVLEHIVSKSWSGFKWEWVENKKDNGKQQGLNTEAVAYATRELFKKQQ